MVAQCQETIYLPDSCKIKCKYIFTYQTDSTKPQNKGSDMTVLEIGDKSSVFYSYYRRLGDSLISEDEKNGTFQNMQDNSGKYYYNAWPSSIAKNYSIGELTVADRLGIYYYKYSEKLESQQWLITDDTATYFNLKCQKATTKFRGRAYSAWFTKEIPITSGPWKFYGLPGLIIKIEDPKQQFSFEFAGIEFVKNAKEPMKIYHPQTSFNNDKFVETTRKELLRLKKLSKEDPIGFAEISSGSYAMKFDMTPEERKARREPFNPIELE